MKLSQLSEYDRAVAEFMVESFNPPIILKTVPKIYVEAKVKMTGHNLYCSLVIYLLAIPPQKIWLWRTNTFIFCGKQFY